MDDKQRETLRTRGVTDTVLRNLEADLQKVEAYIVGLRKTVQSLITQEQIPAPVEENNPQPIVDEQNLPTATPAAIQKPLENSAPTEQNVQRANKPEQINLFLGRRTE